MKVYHIVQVSSYYPPHLGGQENAVHDLTLQLAEKGHLLHVLTSAEGGGPPGDAIEKDIFVTRLASIVFGHAPIMPSFPRMLWRSTHKHSIVHLHIGQAFTPEMVWLVSKLRGFKYIAQLHIDFEPSGPAGVLLPLYKKFILTRALRSARAVIVLNEQTRRTVRDTYGYKGTLRVMNNGIDEAFFTLQRKPLAAKPPSILRLLFVGRLSKQKNILALLKAIESTKHKVLLDIIGEGSEGDIIKKYVRKNNMKNIVLHGRLPRQKVMDFYKTCDALIMPSLYEAQPLVLLEAMAARIPIIGTNVIGVGDHIKQGGIVVEPTAQGLAGGIERYFVDYSLLPKMVDQSYRRAEKLRWHHTLKQYEGLYEEVIDD